MQFEPVAIIQSVYAQIMHHAQSAYPKEAGGLLCGPTKGNLIAEYIPSQSENTGPYALETNPEKEQPNLNRLYIQYGHDVLGYNHSHTGSFGASNVDINTSITLKKRMREHNGREPIMGLAAPRSAGNWQLDFYLVHVIRGRGMWVKTPHKVLSDRDWKAVNALRTVFPSEEREQRISEEVKKLRILFGADVRVFQEQTFVDVDVPFKDGLVRIRLGSDFPRIPPRLWYLADGSQYTLHHEWLHRWSDTMFLWEVVEHEAGFGRPPWIKSLS